ncbi:MULTISPECIES: diaminopimelate decarboxylase [unclassified Streptomyces]|uniref:diaminopimelate decarboxylase n=1 Tax=unclassified Streptomyces TaxID=2593676 RepID=UPI000DC77CC5|nr:MULTISPECIES: diaminopimelate decarboxylase [unclassified Streptomyces]AWZ10652.1 diaminopimelate decarboxylase [Streptomyces sp. ICC4]AWZ18377.1 diaminopimelate decarboxylase [Streptomyces sp. ICC1]
MAVETRGRGAGSAAGRRDEAVRAAVEQGLIGEDPPLVCLLDVAGIRASAAALTSAFAGALAPGTPVLHAFAVKAAPLVPVLRLLADAGIGCEVASPGELALARAAGVAPEHTVLDSPAKTAAELREALALGIAVNADNRQELERLDALVASAPTGSPIGVRINPQTGAGTIDALSTATATSKFGIALRDPGARAWLVRAFLDRPWLTRLHTHSGSQGVPLALIAEGVRELYALAEEINAAAGRRQIDTLDIGGGLPVDFSSDAGGPGYGEYVSALRSAVPGLFSGAYGLVTEFGRSLLAKHGLALSRVEYTKTAGGRAIALTHAGVQLATRTVYAPAAWPLRILPYDAEGAPLTGPPVAQDVAGPACFAGDLLAAARELPLLSPGDLVAVPDTGAYAFTAHYGYNSLPRPAVHGFTLTESGGVRFALVRPAQSLSDITAEAGGSLRDALTGLGAACDPTGRDL